MKYFLILLLAAGCLNTQAQTATAGDSVQTVVRTFFKAMQTADTALLRSTIADSAVFQTIVQRKNQPAVVVNESISGFIQSILQFPKGSLDERIRFDNILIDGPMALAWTPYEFYFNGKFSHCGVNSFQLVRFGEVWKIQYIIDTRRRTGCEGNK
jgi:hypothetical protein